MSNTRTKEEIQKAKNKARAEARKKAKAKAKGKEPEVKAADVQEDKPTLEQCQQALKIALELRKERQALYIQLDSATQHHESEETINKLQEKIAKVQEKRENALRAAFHPENPQAHAEFAQLLWETVRNSEAIDALTYAINHGYSPKNLSRHLLSMIPSQTYLKPAYEFSERKQVEEAATFLALALENGASLTEQKPFPEIIKEKAGVFLMQNAGSRKRQAKREEKAGNPVDLDKFQKIAHMYEQAGHCGNIEGFNDAGNTYKRVLDNNLKAIECFRKSVAQGDMSANAELGNLLEKTAALSTNSNEKRIALQKEALECYKKALRIGDYGFCMIPYYQSAITLAQKLFSDDSVNFLTILPLYHQHNIRLVIPTERHNFTQSRDTFFRGAAAHEKGLKEREVAQREHGTPSNQQGRGRKPRPPK